MIRISSQRVGSRTLVSVAGKLEEEHLAELRTHCDEADRPLLFDLTDLKTADEVSIGWLAEQIADGHEILGASPYINLLLERAKRRSGPLATEHSRGASEDDG